MELDRKLKMGMVGGGRDAFIGAVHRSAALMDGKVEFIAGALSSDPEKAKASAQDLLISEDGSYGTWQEMVEKESKLPKGERIDFVSIVTPNFMHFPIAKAFAEAGIVFALTYNYTGYPMVKQARYMVQGGELGEILKTVVEYPQGWLLTALEKD